MKSQVEKTNQEFNTKKQAIESRLNTIQHQEDEILDDVPQSEAEYSVDSSSDEKPATVMDDDLGFEIEDYSVPENSSATTTGEGVLSVGDET